VNSELICGQVGKGTLGNGTKQGLFSVINAEYSAQEACLVMNRIAKLSARFIGNRGFSIGIEDGESTRVRAKVTGTAGTRVVSAHPADLHPLQKDGRHTLGAERPVPWQGTQTWRRQKCD